MINQASGLRFRQKETETLWPEVIKKPSLKGKDR